MESLLQRKTKGDLVFDTLNYSLLTVVMLLVLYPLYFVVIASVSEPNSVYQGKVFLLPSGFSLDGYKKLIAEDSIWTGYLNTIIYTVLGTTINVSVTIMAAFALSRKKLPLMKFCMLLIIFTMFFNGGMIPNFLLIKDLGWINKIWAIIIPTAVIPYYLIIARTFFQTSIPDELCEAAYIDGASHIYLFVRIVLPLSKALISILVLFYSLFHWNSFFPALLYLRESKLHPLSLILRQILIVADYSANNIMDDADNSSMIRLSELIKYTSIIVATVPILSIYPFVQKYFVQGIMIGSVKG